ncbi:MAG: hypothetical protein R3D65_18190 [Zhengella sp.]|uniref:hypothetical protein n=1 Tax=Zhengella sp. TaxID=2282762 RepID=UPI001D41F663|nr:hypothetical protein [Notoacmeibacter sp.]MCC0028395.1 hypothetical protein [Brucellaceae bacterium]
MGGYLLFLNSAIASMVFAVLVASWWHGRRPEALLLIIASALAVVSGCFEASLLWFDNAHLPRFMLFATHLGGLMFLSAGVAAYLCVPFNWRIVSVFYIAALIVNLLIIDLDRESLFRQTVYQAPYMLMAMTGAVLAWLHGRTAPDRAFAVALTLFALQYAVRPGLGMFTGGVGASPSHFLATSYGALILFIQATTGLLLAGMMIWLMGARLLHDIRSRYAVDPETGFMSRAGVEEKLAAISGAGEAVALALIEPVIKGAYTGFEGEQRLNAELDRLADLLPAHLSETMTAFRAGDARIGILFQNGNGEAIRRWCLGLSEASKKADGATIAAGVALWRTGEAFTTLHDRAAESLYHARTPGGPSVCLRDMNRYVPPAPRLGAYA